MSFIIDRLMISASDGIQAGFRARRAVKDRLGYVKANPDMKAFNVAYKALVNTSRKLEKYYKRHPLLGRIVKWFDTHVILGSFGKKGKIDALIRELKLFKRVDEAKREAENPDEMEKAIGNFKKAAQKKFAGNGARHAFEPDAEVINVDHDEANELEEALRAVAEAQKAERAQNAVAEEAKELAEVLRKIEEAEKAVQVRNAAAEMVNDLEEVLRAVDEAERAERAKNAVAEEAEEEEELAEALREIEEAEKAMQVQNAAAEEVNDLEEVLRAVDEAERAEQARNAAEDEGVKDAEAEELEEALKWIHAEENTEYARKAAEDAIELEVALRAIAEAEQAEDAHRIDDAAKDAIPMDLDAGLSQAEEARIAVAELEALLEQEHQAGNVQAQDVRNVRIGRGRSILDAEIKKAEKHGVEPELQDKLDVQRAKINSMEDVETPFRI